MIEYYLYFKFFHYLFFISWMAVLFYQPRLYVYHAENKNKPEFIKVVEVMEYKMYQYIGYPAVIGSFVTGGLIIAANPALLDMWHIKIKIFVVLALLIYHLSLGHYMKTLKNKTCNKSGIFFRAYNEVPTVALIVIIWIMIVDPF